MTLTNEGKNHIRRYLAGWVPAIAQSIAYGIGASAESASDTALNLEVNKIPLLFTTYDFNNNKLIFKATLPNDFVGKIYEVGIYSLLSDPAENPSRFITSFDSGTEDWINVSDGADSIFGTTSTRIGVNSLLQAPTASATVTSSLSNVLFDLSGFSGSDGMTFAYNVADANTNQIVFKFLTDASNYYSFSMGTQTAGYKIVSTTKGAAVVTGTPSWSNIKEIQVATTAKAGGATSVEFDAIRLEDKDSTNPDYVLVGREVLGAPLTKVDGQTMDIEYSLNITLT